MLAPNRISNTKEENGASLYNLRYMLPPTPRDATIACSNKTPQRMTFETIQQVNSCKERIVEL
jgi:hypothetical protein